MERPNSFTYGDWTVYRTICETWAAFHNLDGRDKVHAGTLDLLIEGIERKSKELEQQKKGITLIGRIKRLCGEKHFTDFVIMPYDVKVSDAIADIIGGITDGSDIFEELPAHQQWAYVVRILRVHGIRFRITDAHD